ncbi:membrane-bound alkaline phosphatase-like [Ochlerotatus camptorhynchus]|uniref:membrane-bound alkaline phosphatase-like n=1 Tax=Ochlerotatus camptorhynchus TaxID=644619 RepID=UPI0031D5EAED
MKTFIVPLAAMLVAVSLANEVHRTYDSDHQHKRSQLQSGRQAVGYDPIETTSEFWQQKAQDILKVKLNEVPTVTKAKNVVYFIGDGMSAQTIAATRMYMGNENRMLSFEQFPYLATAKTYCVNRQVPDSACTATAFMSGVKNNYGMINVGPHVPRYNCEYNRTEAEFLGLLKWAQEAGMATGLVTNTRITHATPAGTYASVADRDWEDDSFVKKAGCDVNEYPDIAHQLIHGEVGKNFKVILGGGRAHFVPSTQMDDENVAGSRTDGRNLINEWKEAHPGNSEYVWNKAGLQSIDVENTENVLGLFQSGHCLYNLEIDDLKLGAVKPKLSEMVEVALKVLSNSANGFFLFVEGGKIDMAHHGTQPRLALEETVEFSRAIELAHKMTNVEDTLIVVSSDHGHTMTYNGYTKRGSDILGIADVSDEDGLPYTTLSYANGAGYYRTYKDANHAEREDISGYNYEDYNTQYLATVPLSSEAHGGEDVAVFASGPLAHVFRGNIEQNVLPDLISYAAKIGQYLENGGEGDGGDDGDGDGSGSSLMVCIQLTVICAVAALFAQLKW